jgi:hypothetical protein
MPENDSMVKDKESNEDFKDFPPVPKEAIVKPEEEHPLKRTIRPEEKLEEEEAAAEYNSAANEDMDSDDSPDWDPALGPSY